MHTLPETLVVRPVTMEDFEDVVDLMTTCLYKKNPASVLSVASLRATWQELDLETCTWAVVTHLGTIVAFASLDARVPSLMQVALSVHPEHDEEGMDAFLMRILEDRARQLIHGLPSGQSAILQRRINVNPEHIDNEASRAYLSRAGFTLKQHFWQMWIEFNQAPVAPTWPATVKLRRFQAQHDEEAVLRILQEAFQEQGAEEVEHVTRMTRAALTNPGLDSDIWYVVTADEEVIATELCEPVADKGWVHIIGVQPQWRRHGLGSALLQEAFCELYHRGARNVGLHVDAKNSDGAIQLYERVGMTSVQHMLLYEKDLTAS